MGLACCGTVFPVSVVVGAAVPAAVCRWGLCPCCPSVARCLSGVNISSIGTCRLQNSDGLKYGLYTILPLPIFYGIYCNKGGSGGIYYIAQ